MGKVIPLLQNERSDRSTTNGNIDSISVCQAVLCVQVVVWIVLEKQPKIPLRSMMKVETPMDALKPSKLGFERLAACSRLSKYSRSVNQDVLVCVGWR